jgi:hypothetical protein
LVLVIWFLCICPLVISVDLGSRFLGIPHSILRMHGALHSDVLLHRLRYALPGWDAAAERRDAQGEFHSVG